MVEKMVVVLAIESVAMSVVVMVDLMVEMKG
jgi:hypothetical protein